MNTPDSTKAESSAPIKRNSSRKSTTTEAQYERVLAMLRTGPKNTMELRRAGVMMPAARVKEMNEKLGYNIPRIDLVDLWDEWGFKHSRIAVYALHAEPELAMEQANV
jgi:hypothetical protein